MSNDWPALLMHTWSCLEWILLFLIPSFGAVFSILYLSFRVYFILLISNFDLSFVLLFYPYCGDPAH